MRQFDTPLPFDVVYAQFDNCIAWSDYRRNGNHAQQEEVRTQLGHWKRVPINQETHGNIGGVRAVRI